MPNTLLVNCAQRCVQAALAAIRVFKKVPEMLEDSVEGIKNLLKDRTHGVLLTALQVCAVREFTDCALLK